LRTPATWIRCLASHSVPLHATAEPSAQTWHTFLRNQAFAISTIGLGEAGRLLDELLALVRGWIELVVRCVTKVRDRSPCGFMERSSTLHPVPPYRSSNLTDWRDPHNGSTPVPPPLTTLGGRTHWTTAGRRLSPYRSRASPRRKLAGIQKSCATNRYCADAPGEPRSMGRYAARLPRTTRSKTNDPQCPCPTPRPFYESAVADKVLRCYGASGEGVASFGR
jgi:hypothetical protein